MIKSFFISCILSCLSVISIAQEIEKTIEYPLNKGISSLGLTGGHGLIFTSLELSIHHTQRVSSSACLEFKAQGGLWSDTGVISESRIDKYFYAGLSPALLLGKRNKFFELAIGGAYFIRRTETMSGKPNRLIPTGSAGFRLAFNNSSFRLGIGAPNGIYLGFTVSMN